MKERSGEYRANPENTTNGNTSPEKQNWYDRPHKELVASIRSSIANAREGFEKKHGRYAGMGECIFDPVLWLSDNLALWITQKTPDERYASIGMQRGDILAAERPFLGFSLAWDVVSYPYYKSKHDQGLTRSSMFSKAGQYVGGDTSPDECTIRLEPKAAKLLDAMADAVGIPRTRGEFTYDLIPVPPNIPTTPTMFRIVVVDCPQETQNNQLSSAYEAILKIKTDTLGKSGRAKPDATIKNILNPKAEQQIQLKYQTRQIEPPQNRVPKNLTATETDSEPLLKEYADQSRPSTGKEQGNPHTERSNTNETYSFEKNRRWFVLAYQELFADANLSPKPANFFEEVIYWNGTFEFHRDEFSKKTKSNLRHFEMYSRIRGDDEKTTFRDLAQAIQYAHYTMLWQEHFNGKIPKGWDKWGTARSHALGETGDIEDWSENAIYSYLIGGNDEKNRPLGPYLISVCITHPSTFVACTVSTTYRLDQKQFAWIVTRPDLSGSKRQQIIAAQRQMGATEEEIAAVLCVAEAAHQRMNGENSVLINVRTPSFLH